MHEKLCIAEFYFVIFFIYIENRDKLKLPPNIILYSIIIAHFMAKIVSEYDQEIPQSQTAGNPVAPWGRAAKPSRDTRKTN